MSGEGDRDRSFIRFQSQQCIAGDPLAALVHLVDDVARKPHAQRTGYGKWSEHTCKNRRTRPGSQTGPPFARKGAFNRVSLS